MKEIAGNNEIYRHRGEEKELTKGMGVLKVKGYEGVWLVKRIKRRDAGETEIGEELRRDAGVMG